MKAKIRVFNEYFILKQKRGGKETKNNNENDIMFQRRNCRLKVQMEKT